MPSGRVKSNKTLFAIDAARRFPDSSEADLTRYIEARHRGLYKSSQDARTCVRIARDSHEDNEKKRARQNAYNNATKSIASERNPYVLPNGLWGILADPHIPFHSEIALTAALKWFKKQKVTGLLFAGDTQDCEALSYWMPTHRPNFLAEVEQTIDFLDMIKHEFKGKKLVMMRGNHEDRLETYYRANAPMLCDLPSASMESILSLEKRGITMTERKQKVIARELTILHGHEMRGSYSVVSPARWAMLKAKSCCAVGHFHATSECTARQLDGKVVSTWSIGCLCDLEPDYNPYGNTWNWGCALLNLDKDGWELENKKILANGKVV